MILAPYHHIISPEIERAIGKVGVLCGGISAERQVSLWSGKAVYDALARTGLTVSLFDVNRYFIDTLQKKPFDYAFIVLHGRGGEDGTLQAVLDWMHIPYTGSGVKASAITMDKILSKTIWAANDLPVLPQMVLDKDFNADEIVSTLGLPIAIKPALEGSSIGISKVLQKSQLKAAYQRAAPFDTVIMAEPWIQGHEVTGAIIGNNAMPLISIQIAEGFYDYEAKYITGADEYRCPSGLPAEQETNIQQLMLKATDVLGCQDWARVDVMIDAQEKPWLLEVNTIPGMTETSLVPKATRAAGLSFEETVLNILKSSWESYHA